MLLTLLSNVIYNLMFVYSGQAAHELNATSANLGANIAYQSRLMPSTNGGNLPAGGDNKPPDDPKDNQPKKREKKTPN